MTLIRPIFSNNWENVLDSDNAEEDNSSDGEIIMIPEKGNMHSRGDDSKYKYYIIHDIKINAFNNSKIRIHLSLMDETGEKSYKIINENIFFDIYVEAKNENEKILTDLKCYDDTPEYIDNKYSAMGYKRNPSPVWRINIDRNKIKYIYEFCEYTKRAMYLNTELNDAFPLVQKGIGIYTKIPYKTSRYISYTQMMRLNEEELKTKTIRYSCRKISIDIEVFIPNNWKIFPEAQEKGCEIIIIACTFQNDDREYDTVVLYIDKKDRNINVGEHITKRKFIKFGIEEDMLRHFINMISAYNVDLITGWNIRNFDLKYIYTRCEKFYPTLLNDFKNWTMSGENITFRNTTRKGQNVTLVDCFGIIILDMYDYNKANIKAKSYKLKDIAKMFLQEDKQKIDMDYKNISKYFSDGNDEEFSKLLEYCSVDAEIVLDLMNIQKVWNNTVSMADICHVPINYVINHGVMLRNTCMISQFINENTCYLLPYKHEHPFIKYEGGFVNEPIVGFHSNPIFVLDFNSLYPTTMLAFNICTTTIVHPEKLNIESVLEDEDGNFNPQNLSELCSMSGDGTLEIFKTPYMRNVGFVSENNRKGVMPQILDNLLKTRKKLQNELKQTSCPNKKKQLDAQQLTYKLCANAIYGLLGCSFSPLYNPEVAASVTGFGRFLSFIKRKFINNYMLEDNIEGRIIYGDTDSVMVEIQNMSIEETRNIAIKYAEKITKDIGISPIKTEYEKIFCPFLIHKKKHYIGVMYTNNCKKHDKIEYKGNEMVRSDNCSLTTNVMKEIIEILFFYKNDSNISHKITETSKCIERILNEWSIIYNGYLEGDKENISPELLRRVVNNAIFSKKLSKEVYKNKLPHVAVYERMKNQKQYTIGDRIVFCIANTEFTDKIKPKNIIEMSYDIDEFLNSKELFLSVHYYLDACVRKPLYRLFETLDIEFKENLERTITKMFPPIKIQYDEDESKRKRRKKS